MQHIDDMLCWMALVYLFLSRPNIGINLVEECKSASAVFNSKWKNSEKCFSNTRDTAEKIGKFNNWKECEGYLKSCKTLGFNIITYLDDSYPPLLRMIDSPPIVLFTKGSLHKIVENPSIAIVGSRKVSSQGRNNAFDVSYALAECGINIVSGMAYGVDCSAHLGAIEAKGNTIAVWGAGPDIVYPRAHKKLAESIAENGAVITEFPPGTDPRPYYFPQRNRIISALSLGVVVVEAAQKSGSLITAKYALEQGREVCVFPGGAGLVTTAGSNKLIKEGACLVESAQDVIDAVFKGDFMKGSLKKTGHYENDSATESRKIFSRSFKASSFKKEKLAEQKMADPLIRVFQGREKIDLDEIVKLSEMSPAVVLERLTCLEIEGMVEKLPGRYYRIARK